MRCRMDAPKMPHLCASWASQDGGLGSLPRTEHLGSGSLYESNANIYKLAEKVETQHVHDKKRNESCEYISASQSHFQV